MGIESKVVQPMTSAPMGSSLPRTSNDVGSTKKGITKTKTKKKDGGGGGGGKEREREKKKKKKRKTQNLFCFILVFCTLLILQAGTIFFSFFFSTDIF